MGQPRCLPVRIRASTLGNIKILLKQCGMGKKGVKIDEVILFIGFEKAFDRIDRKKLICLLSQQELGFDLLVLTIRLMDHNSCNSTSKSLARFVKAFPTRVWLYHPFCLHLTWTIGFDKQDSWNTISWLSLTISHSCEIAQRTSTNCKEARFDRRKIHNQQSQI